MRTSARLALGFGVLLAVLLPVVAYLGFVIHRVVDSSRELAVSGTSTLVTSWEQMEALHRYRENTQKWWITGDPRYSALADSAWRGFGTRVGQLAALSRLGGEGDEIRKLTELWATASERTGNGQSAVPPRVNPGDALLVLDARVGPLRDQTLRVHAAGQAAMESEVRRAEALGDRAEQVAIGLGIAAILLGFVVAAVMIRSLGRAVVVLQDGTRAVARGDFQHRMNESRRDEFGQVARDFNRMTERLGELDQLKQDFVSHVSHELKTPLASMREIDHLLLDDLAGPLTAHQRQLLGLNLRSGERLSSMITRLLDLSTIEAGRMEYDLRDADLSGVVREVLEPFAAREQDCRLDVRLVPVRAHVDVERFDQVVGNLVENALKFSPAESRVIVTLSRREGLPAARSGAARAEDGGHGGWAVLTVEDEGPGVPAAERERIFERFVRLPSAGGARRPGGVGLGLALSRQIVAAHRGYVWVEERAGGAGARFVVAIPAIADAAPVLADPGPPSRLFQTVG